MNIAHLWRPAATPPTTLTLRTQPVRARVSPDTIDGVDFVGASREKRGAYLEVFERHRVEVVRRETCE